MLLCWEVGSQTVRSQHDKHWLPPPSLSPLFPLQCDPDCSQSKMCSVLGVNQDWSKKSWGSLGRQGWLVLWPPWFNRPMWLMLSCSFFPALNTDMILRVMVIILQQQQKRDDQHNEKSTQKKGNTEKARTIPQPRWHSWADDPIPPTVYL